MGREGRREYSYSEMDRGEQGSMGGKEAGKQGRWVESCGEKSERASAVVYWYSGKEKRGDDWRGVGAERPA